MAPTEFQWVTIKGFKSIRSIVEFPLRRINVIVGANGSGKSNFLEAFVFLGEAEAGNIESYVQYYGGAEKLLHYGSRITQDILVACGASDGLPRFAKCQYALSDRLIGTAEWPPAAIKGPSFNRYRFNDTSDHSRFKKTSEIDNNRALSRLGGNLPAFLYRLKRMYPASFRLIEKTVQQVAPYFGEFILEPLALNRETIKLEWRHKNSDGYWDASSFSDGTLRFIALATLLLQPPELRASVILIDEPELGLHPFAIQLLVSLIRQASVDTQVVVATQSPLLVDYFEPEEVLVANRVDGATDIKRLETGPFEEWLKEYSLGQLWEKGEFAGRPVKE